jgi:hypothetical protein
MNINQTKAFAWLVSAGITAGVGYYVYDFQQRQKAWSQEFRIPRATAQAILKSAVAREGPKFSLVAREAIERSYYYDPRNRQLPNLLDWTGAPPKVVIDKPDEPAVEPVHKIEMVGDKLTVLQILEDVRQPELSRIWLNYSDDSGVAPLLDPAKLHQLRVGDSLAAPLDYASVVAISAREGVTFTFTTEDGEEREDEVVPPVAYDVGVAIHKATDGTVPIRAPRADIPRLDSAAWRPEHTMRLDNNVFVIGEIDKTEFADDFGGIIAREVRHSRHFNSKTGKYDGIELKEVKPGGKIAGHGGQSGDIIKSINGHPVTSTSEAISFVKNNQDKYDKWIVVVENKGKERTMTFDSPE